MRMVIVLAALMIILSSCSATVKETTSPFTTPEACKEARGCECRFVNCDNIPEGKSVEEVCGKNFKKGWQC